MICEAVWLEMMLIWENVGSAKRRIISKTVEETPMHGKAEA
jgi:hypothetical protein